MRSRKYGLDSRPVIERNMNILLKASTTAGMVGRNEGAVSK